MVHSFLFSRIFSLTNSSQSEKQMVTVKSMTSTSEMRNSFDDDQGDEEDEESHCQPNENPLKSCGSEMDEHSRWSNSCPVDTSGKQWTWISPDESDSCSSFSYCQWGHQNRRKRRIWLSVGVTSVILVTFVTILVVLLCPPNTFSRTTSDNGGVVVFNIENDTLGLSSNSNSDSEFESENEDESDEDSINVNSRKLDLQEMSRLSWNLLNSNNNNNNNHPNRNQMSNTVATLPDTDTIIENEGEIILPAKMVYTSTGGDNPSDKTLAVVRSSHGINVGGGGGNGGGSGGNDNKKKRSCCRTQKYSQVVKRDGCEPVTIVNKMCFGQCVSVWVPGLFASFPVCRPSRSHWKVVTLKCGQERDKRKRVRIERVRRCSCMEIEPTTSDVAMNLS